MTDLNAQKRLAADVLDVGTNSVWFDPDEQGEIADAITREDIRSLVQQGVIQAEEPQGNSRGRAREREAKRAYGHRQGPGSRKGTAGARQDPKDAWEADIRAQRRVLRELRDSGEIDRSTYRELYRKAAGGEFRSVQYLLNYVEDHYGEVDYERGED